MPKGYLGSRTTDSATWLRTPKNRTRPAAHRRAAEARSRTVADGPQLKQPAKDAADCARQQQHTTQPGSGQGSGQTNLHEPLAPLDSYPDELARPAGTSP
ncbi:hypothetical protein [Streptomyces sp. NPDC058657]|uniref:hypothetical protein n=1 Tax=unclassified Streptomyces TaxID=2593676 RepID=UPI00364D37C2